MRKIPTAFERDWDGDRRYVTREINPECEWVFQGEGIPTRKYDGTCMMLDDDGRWWARREVKSGKATPAGFLELATDGETGKTVGWEPVEQSSFARWHGEALVDPEEGEPFPAWPTGTYELVGPKVNGDPEGLGFHSLFFHGYAETLDAPRSFDELAVWLHAQPYEGVVWHHADGRMAKIKKRDFRAPGS